MCILDIRFNPIRPNSIQAFASVHSRRSSSLRQVYFLRADGAGPQLLPDLAAADKAMSSDKNTAYCRLVSLSTLSDPAAVSTYLRKYQAFKKGEKLLLPEQPELSAEIADSLRELFGILRSVRPDMTETYERNIAVQLLYRTEEYLLGLLAQRKDKYCKLIYSGCTKTSEYLFGCLAALLGIDTLILMPEGIGSIPEKLLQNCAEISYGAHSPVKFPEYVPPKAEDKPPVPQKKAEPKAAPPVKIQIPQRRPRAAEVPFVHEQKSAPKTETPRERSYEELAALAESVVMIIIEDESGTPVASGSGIAIHPDGYILTNCHVIASGSSFCVRIENDDKIYDQVRLVKYNPVFDLALIRIQRQMPPLPVYDDRRKLRRGEKVFAIGSPMGLFNSVSDGIISGFRTIKDRDMIQFTAPISHGSSGGALLNCCGELIGICTGGIDEGQNLNLAVSYQHIRSFASNIL